MQVVSGAVLERWNGLSDEDVVGRVLAGQTGLFELLMRRHNERLYRAVRAILRNDLECEEVMQQAYVNGYVHLHQFERAAKFSTWLTRIAVNEALARARLRGRYRQLDDEQGGETTTVKRASEGIDPEHQAFASELGVLIESAVDALADGVREVFVLRQVQGLNTAETADVLGVSEDVVKTRLSRARAALRDDLFERAGLAAGSAFRFGDARCDRVVAAVLGQIC
jgi:RNA polymerase sigma-70 factor (ECF subfamily)